MHSHEGPSVVYLAAAVSDFYIENPADHKIQSREISDLTLTFQPVPKLLGKIREWSPNSTVVSFKLETDHTILEKKVMQSFNLYGVDMVIANLLQTYKTECILFTKEKREVIRGGNLE